MDWPKASNSLGTYALFNEMTLFEMNDVTSAMEEIEIVEIKTQLHTDNVGTRRDHHLA